MTTYNHNKQPYFDDFNPNKNFVSVLFKPKVPVQARELNQVQSILYNQMNRFSSHIFKHGSPVKGSPPKYVVANYITLESISPFDSELVSINKIHGTLLRGTTSGIEATIIYVCDATNESPHTVYVKYTKTAIDNNTSVFLNGEIIDVIDDLGIVSYKIKIRCPSCPNQSQSFINIVPTGYGSLWYIQTSTYFIDGMFIDVLPSIIVADKYSRNTSSYKVGFDVISDIVTSDTDISLLDNALGYPNYQAPGADRERVRLIPVIRSLQFVDGDKFIPLAIVKNGKIKYVNDIPAYSDIMDILARRTYDESGNYTTKQFGISFKEHLAKSDNDPNGVYTINNGGDESKFVAIVRGGTGYVRGYEVRNTSETEVIIDKPRETKKLKSYLNRTGGLNYILVSGAAIVTKVVPNDPTEQVTSIFSNIEISLYDGVPVNNLPTGNMIGTLKGFDILADFEHEFGHTWRVHFVDMKLIPGKQYQDVKCLSGIFVSGEHLLVPTVDSYTGKPNIYDADKSSLVYYLGKKNVKSLRDINNSTQSSMSYSQRKKFHGVLNSAGAFTWVNQTNETFQPLDLGSTYAHIISGTDYIPLGFNTISLTADSITVNTGNSANSGKVVQLVHTVLNSNVFEKTKSLVAITESDKQLNGTTFNLTKSDLHKIVKITLNDSLSTDVTKHFKWTNGQTDWAYVPITLTSNYPFLGDARFTIEYEYYQHSDTGHFFSVDSYSAIVNTIDNNYHYGDIPSFKTSDNQLYNLRDCLDFRPLVLDNSIVSLVQPALNSIFISDIEFYLPRTDLMVVNKNGTIYSKPGISAENPIAPQLDVLSEMAIYSYRIAAYLNNIETDIVTSFIENKRYTMRDIGKLDNRITELENFTNFTTLERRLVDTPIKNINGIELYKNGFMVDCFNSFRYSAIDDTEFKCVIDRTHYEVVPQYTMFNANFDFIPSDSTNYKQYGNIIMLNHYDEPFITQPFASEAIVINTQSTPSITGKAIIVPNITNWADLENDPKVVIDAKVGLDSIPINKLGLAGIESNVWEWLNEATNTNNLQSDNAVRLIDVNNNLNTQTIGNNIYKNQENVKSQLKVCPLIEKQRFQVFATGLKPNTKVYCFFDGINVSDLCRPLNTKTNYGDDIVVDNLGNVKLEFKLPKERFRSGPKVFKVTNNAVLETSAETILWTAGTWASVNTYQNTFTSATQHAIQLDDTNTPDPIAQTFSIDVDCYITGISLYFQSIHPDDMVCLELRNVIDGTGIPGDDVLGGCNVKGRDIITSSNASVKSELKLLYPVYVKAGYNYAMVISSVKPSTKIWVGELGQYDVIQFNKLINKQFESTGLYKSQNNMWTEIINYDLKYAINRAIFTASNMQLTFNNRVVRDYNSMSNAIETQSGSNLVRIHRSNHGVAIGDIYKFDLSSGIWLNFTLNNISDKFSIGQRISTTTGVGTISDIKPGIIISTIDCQLSDITGHFSIGQQFTVNNFTQQLTDRYVTDSFVGGTTTFNSAISTITGTCNSTSIIDINGIPSTDFNNDIAIVSIDSINSFIIQLSTPATTSGIVELNVYLNLNLKYDKFVVSCSNPIINGCTNSWVLSGIGHQSFDLFSNLNYIKQYDIPFKIGELVNLNSPFKFANDYNEIRVFGNTGKSIGVVGTFNSDNQYVSPVININSLSVIGIANKIDNDIDANIYDVIPNGLNRFIPETNNRNGISSYKYISKVMTLKNSAIELKIIVEVCKPLYSNFDIYIKTLNIGDSRIIDDVDWILMPIEFKKNFTSITSNDFQHIEFIVGEVLPTMWNNKTATFKAVKVKLVGKTKNTSNPPKFKNLKVIALT